MTEATATRGPRGLGSIYRRASGGRWIAAYDKPRLRDEPRRRATLSGTLYCDVLRRYSEARPLSEDPPRLTRKEQMTIARTKGTHTASEWHALCWSVRNKCAYCRRQAGTFTITKDHRVPVSRGGSDGIENIAVSCRRCNFHKNNMTDVEFVDYLERTGLGKKLAKEPLDVDWHWTRRSHKRLGEPHGN